jgi:hypothetical protein
MQREDYPVCSDLSPLLYLPASTLAVDDGNERGDTGGERLDAVDAWREGGKEEGREGGEEAVSREETLRSP